MSVLSFIAIRAPEMAGIENIADIILIADKQTGAFGDEMIGTIGTQREYAVALRVMHIIARMPRDGASANVNSGSDGQGGMITSEKEGELSRSYKVTDDLARRYPDLVTTVWGQELIQLITGTFLGPRLATMDMVVG
jgi:hypothetical protein